MSGKLIHVGRFHPEGGGVRYVYLREKDSHHFVWYEVVMGEEKETEISAFHPEEAIKLAQKIWKKLGFRTVICGFRYTLPERDEHGMNALFHQMKASYESMNGIYFDEELGHNCIVQNASKEARDILRNIKE